MTGWVLPTRVSWPLDFAHLVAVKDELVGDEASLGELGGVEDIGALEVLVEGGGAGVDRGDVEADVDLPVLAARSNCTVPSFSKRARLTEAPKWSISKVAKVWVGSIA